MKTWRLSAASIGILLVALRVNAQSSAAIEVDAQPGITYGMGYDTHRKAFLKQCVKFPPKVPKYESGQALSDAKFELVTSTSDIVNKMQLSVDASFSALVGGGKLSLSSKNALVSGSSTNQYNLSLLAYSYEYARPQYLPIAKVSLTKEYRDMLDNGQKDKFKASCGDVFVVGIRQGREFYGTVRVDNQDMKSWSKFNTDNSVDYKNASIQAGVDVKFEKSIERSFKATDIKVNARSNLQGLENPTNLEELVDLYHNFNKKKGDGGDIKFYLVSYQALGDVKVDDPLDLNQIDVEKGYLVTALWDLKAMQDDANFILNNRDMFALGTTKGQQDKRFKNVKILEKRWGDEFWSLQAQTKKCMENYTDQCRTLAQRYKERDIDLATERAMLPERYTSDCYADTYLDVNRMMDGFFAMPVNLGKHEFGDDDMNGGPVRTASWLRMRPDGRELKARYEVVLEEWKMKNGVREAKDNNWMSRFHYTSTESSVHKLDDMGSNLKQCNYTGIGVQGAVPAPDLLGAPNNPFVFSNKQDLVAGYTAYVYPNNPPHDQVVTMTDGAHGALASLRCVMDTKGGEDNKLTCQKPDTSNIKLSLVNQLDVEADKWTSDQLPRVTVEKIKAGKRQKQQDEQETTKKRRKKNNDANE